MALQRFRDALHEALHERGVDPARPITVAEIYQDLVPYRTHRDVLGVEMNGDYEHLLLRALAGEEDVLELQSRAALEQIREELESSNPNTTLYRDFAAVDVLISNPESAPGQPAMRDDDVAEVDVAALAPSADDSHNSSEMVIEPLGADLMPDSDPGDEVDPTADPTFISGPETPMIESPEAQASASDSEPCQWCRQVLPDRENLNFCPFCGTDLRIVPCGNCGEALEPDWRFCISCGDEVVSTE